MNFEKINILKLRIMKFKIHSSIEPKPENIKHIKLCKKKLALLMSGQEINLDFINEFDNKQKEEKNEE